MGPGKVPTDDELLAAIHAMLDPGAAAFTRLVDAVPPLSDDAFQTLLADSA